jgi:hypothetical protein
LRTIYIQRAYQPDLQSHNGLTILWVRETGHGEGDDFVFLPKMALKAMHSWILDRSLGLNKGALFLSQSRQNKVESLTTWALHGMVKSMFDEA